MSITDGAAALRHPAEPSLAGSRARREAVMEQERLAGMATVGAAPGVTLEVHFKLFGTDGVSLQSQELSKALSVRGWRVLPCAGDVPPDAAGLRLPELSYQSAEAIALRKRVFAPVAGTASDGAALVEEITGRAAVIHRQIRAYVDAHQIPLLHVRNLMSLPYNLPATLAVYDLAAQRPDIGFLLQHHDLYWEGPNARNFVTPYRQVSDLMDRVMCPSLPNARHVLINPIAAEALQARKGLHGTVVPDGFDFDRDVPPIDDLAFRGKLRVLAGDPGPVGPDDLVVVMPARIAINKAIELAIQFAARLDRERAALESAPDGLGRNRRRFGPDSSVVLLLPQGEDVEDNRAYLDTLIAYARHSKVKLVYGGDIVVPDLRFRQGDPDHYPFYGTYRAADLVCYPPEHEGFGNQAIETVWAKLPLVVLEYPVFQRFVRPHVPHYISLGDTSQLEWPDERGGLHQLRRGILDRAVKDAVALLTDHHAEKKWADENFTALRAFCGMDIIAAQYIRLYGELKEGPAVTNKVGAQQSSASEPSKAPGRPKPHEYS
jgi:mannosylglucosylglycerate synthase